MKFLFEKFSAPIKIGRYGSGDIAVNETAHLPYLFIMSVIFFILF